jgi:hypothetical protein
MKTVDAEVAVLKKGVKGVHASHQHTAQRQHMTAEGQHQTAQGSIK